MFGFGKKKSAPPLHPGNPGIGVEAKVAFSSGERTWNESFHVVRIAADVLRRHGHKITDRKTWLEHDQGFLLQPQLVGLQPLEDGGVQTVTTMQIDHPALAAEGVFEYQHATGDDVNGAIAGGIDQWVRTDWPVLLDALQARPATCTAMEMKFPATAGRPARTRRALLGPIAHFMQHPPEGEGDRAGEDHPFCPCCLVTKSFEAFRELIEGEGFYCLRLFAARDAEGNPQADCRVNGEDWERGAQALREYAATWSPAGYEFRKQYVVLQTCAGTE